jgi:predicted alpha/beta superfamily hydrolase
MRVVLLAIVICFVSATTAQVPGVSVKPFILGETRVIFSPRLKENRTLNIYLPEQYDSSKPYPVIYLLDGSANEDFVHIAGLLQFFYMAYQVPPHILVGIANVDRKRDFTFQSGIAALKKSYPTTGSSGHFIDFIEFELQPFIRSAYKTTGVNYIIGQSLGGLLALEILVKKPKLFTHYLVVSPSLWWDDESLLKSTRGLSPASLQNIAYLYICAGGKEEAVMKKDAQQMYTILKKIIPQPGKIHFLLLPAENHATILHQAIIEAFKRLFPFKP